MSDIEDLQFHDCCSVSNELEQKYGFKRSNFKSKSLNHTVKYHEKHILYCTGQLSTKWKPSDPKKNEFVNSLVAQLDKCNVEYKLTGCEDAPKKPGAHDLIIYPDMTRITGLTIEEIPKFVKEYFVEKSTKFSVEKLDGVHVLVCCHHARDKRCGTCGPRIFKEFVEQGKKLLNEPIHVRRVTHVGGHEYAANVIVYNKRDDKYIGDWFGYVSVEDVTRILKEYVIGGKMLEDIWRGRCGVKENVKQKE